MTSESSKNTYLLTILTRYCWRRNLRSNSDKIQQNLRRSGSIDTISDIHMTQKEKKRKVCNYQDNLSLAITTTLGDPMVFEFGLRRVF